MDVQPSRGSPSQAPALFLNVSHCQPMIGAGAARVGGPGEAVSQAPGRHVLEVLGRGAAHAAGPQLQRLWAAGQHACHQALVAGWLEGEHRERLEV